LFAGSRAISSARLGTTFQPLTGNPGDGANPHCAIIDEYHEHKTALSYDALATGMGARAQPMLWTITTAGYDRASPCYDLDMYARQVLQGILEDDALFSVIYQLDDSDEWTDSDMWVKANPNMGISVNPVQMAEQCREAQHSPFKQNVFKTKRLNLWVSAGSNWLNMHYWDECQDSALRLEAFKGRRVYLGLDLASRIDLAALVILVPMDNGQFALFAKCYLPEDVVEMNAATSHAHYAGWARDGWITLTPGNVIDFGYIKEDILRLCEIFQVDAVCFDPMQATQLSAELIEMNVPMRETKQWATNLVYKLRGSFQMAQVTTCVSIQKPTVLVE
jgi:phage terminase large subunit-like protein